jgi:tripartite-type tricarboxylate transporter receptor subunit TctC
MPFPRRRFLQWAAAGAAASAPPALVRSAGAQAWPTHPVRLVVGYPPGGGADATARIVASRLSEMWPQQVVIENKAGAGGNIAKTRFEPLGVEAAASNPEELAGMMQAELDLWAPVIKSGKIKGE